ncbi:hypothetical protein EZS27_017512 [termite gut metagenome]|uniref:Uncharacterized protein n=1 Tax=termite gut metagenome TaxID=433724 RepID=A0A5J4RLA2_9ZZZZ
MLYFIDNYMNFRLFCWWGTLALSLTRSAFRAKTDEFFENLYGTHPFFYYICLTKLINPTNNSFCKWIFMYLLSISSQCTDGSKHVHTLSQVGAQTI